MESRHEAAGPSRAILFWDIDGTLLTTARAGVFALEEAAAYLALSTWTVRDLVWKGRLPVVRLTRRLHFDRRDLDRLIDHAKDNA